jgi:hypothetical protein
MEVFRKALAHVLKAWQIATLSLLILQAPHTTFFLFFLSLLFPVRHT